MSGYSNGADLERAAKKSLEADGYYVIKSGGSKGIVDLAAFKPGETLFVQCKLKGYLAPAERTALWQLARRMGAIPLVARWYKNGRAARVVGLSEIVLDDGPAWERAWTADHGITEVAG